MESIDSASPMEFEDAGGGPYGHAALQGAWDKLYRARSILEAEQAHIRDDRIALQGEIDALGAREQAVAARELRIRQIELQSALLKEEEQEEREEMEGEGRILHCKDHTRFHLLRRYPHGLLDPILRIDPTHS